MPRKKLETASEQKKAKTAPKTARTATETKSKGKQPTEQKKATQAKSEAVSPIARPPALKQVIYSLEAGTPIFVKTADICSATGKTNQWIGQLTAQGIIHKTKTNHGALYEFFETMKAYCAMLEDRAKKEDDDIAQIELRKKKAEVKYKESRATKADLEVKEFQGKMHRSEDVQAVTADLLYFVRGGLMALAGRCANDCAASSEPAEIQKIIEREVFAVLDELSNYKYDAKRYDELVRQRNNRELDIDYFADDEEL